MRKNKLILILALTLAISGLTACTNKAAPDDQTTGTGPATLQGQSEHWSVALDYVSGGQGLEEEVSVKTSITQQEMDEVTVTINHKDQEPAVLPVTEPSLFKSGQLLTFTQKNVVKTWKDTDVVVEWKIGDKRMKEYVTMVNKAADASKK